jgi:hypothetical protein
MSYQETVVNNASFNSKKFLKALELFEDLRWKDIVTESYHTSFGFVHQDKDYLMSIGCGTFYGGYPIYTEKDARSCSKFEVAILDLNPSRANEWATGKFFNHTSEDEEVTRVSKDSLVQLIADLLA